MRIVINNLNAMNGQNKSDFRVQIPLGIDYSRRDFKCSIEQIIISESSSDSLEASYLTLHSDTINTNTIDSSGSVNSSTLTFCSWHNHQTVTGGDINTFYYQGDGSNSFNIYNLSEIQHFWISSPIPHVFADTNIYTVSIILNLKEIV
jgi:hypothetical protein